MKFLVGKRALWESIDLLSWSLRDLNTVYAFNGMPNMLLNCKYSTLYAQYALSLVPIEYIEEDEDEVFEQISSS